MKKKVKLNSKINGKKVYFPECPEDFPEDFNRLLNKISEYWYKSNERPKLSKKVLKHWDGLIEDWANDDEMPLLIRKSSQGRGSIHNHKETGRKLIPTDNTPAKWIFSEAYLKGSNVQMNDIKKMVNKKEIPIALALHKKERRNATFTNTKGYLNLNKYNWKLCHIDGVGLRKRKKIDDFPIDELKKHFKLFLSPSNMFLIPKELSGLGEIPNMLKCMEKIRHYNIK